jgi:hypothetical protein
MEFFSKKYLMILVIFPLSISFAMGQKHKLFSHSNNIKPKLVWFDTSHAPIQTSTFHCDSIPKNAEDLTSGIRYSAHYLEESDSESLSAFGYVSGSHTGTKSIIIVDFILYKDVLCTNDQSHLTFKYRYAVGARLLLTIHTSKGKVNISLAEIAAQVELNKAEVSYSLHTIGITGGTVVDTIAPLATTILSGDFDVTGYTNILKAVDNIIQVIYKGDPKTAALVPPTAAQLIAPKTQPNNTNLINVKIIPQLIPQLITE